LPDLSPDMPSGAYSGRDAHRRHRRPHAVIEMSRMRHVHLGNPCEIVGYTSQ